MSRWRTPGEAYAYETGYIEGRADAKLQWIPIKTRPMTDEEREHYKEYFDLNLTDDEAVMFDCQTPEDGQRIWISTIHGNVFEDFCENDGDFLGLEGNGDWRDVTAWMPMFVPEPWKGECLK